MLTAVDFAVVDLQRKRRKNARRSPINKSGASVAAKWPPRSNCDQCTMLLVRSASLRSERKFPGKTATPVGVEFLTWR